MTPQNAPALLAYETLCDELGVPAARRALAILDGTAPRLALVDVRQAKQEFARLRRESPRTPTARLARQVGVSLATAYRWNSKIVSQEPLSRAGGTCDPTREDRAVPSESRRVKRSRPRRRKYRTYRGADPSSPHIGVSRDRKWFRAYVRAGGVFVFRKLFRTEQEAARAAHKARKQYIAQRQREAT